jgi:hypothetical protein
VRHHRRPKFTSQELGRFLHCLARPEGSPRTLPGYGSILIRLKLYPLTLTRPGLIVGERSEVVSFQRTAMERC